MRKLAFVALMSLQLGTFPVEPSWAAAPTDPFRDVDEHHWAYPAVDWLRQQGLLEGWGHRFHGRRHFSRYEMAEILARFTQMLEEAHPGATRVLRRASRPAGDLDSDQLVDRLREIRRGFSIAPEAARRDGEGKTLRQLQADLERVAALVATHHVLLENPRDQGPWRRRLRRDERRRQSAVVGRKLELSATPPDPAKVTLMKELDLLTAAERQKAKQIEAGVLQVRATLAAATDDPETSPIRARLALARNLRSGDSRPQPSPAWTARAQEVTPEPALDAEAARELARPAPQPEPEPEPEPEPASESPRDAISKARAAIAKERAERISGIRSLLGRGTERASRPIERIVTPPPTTPTSQEAVPPTLEPLGESAPAPSARPARPASLAPAPAPAPARVLAAADAFARQRRQAHAVPARSVPAQPVPATARTTIEPPGPTPAERKARLLAAAETARQRAEAAGQAAARGAARSGPTQVVTLEELKGASAKPSPRPEATSTASLAPAEVRPAAVRAAHRSAALRLAQAEARSRTQREAPKRRAPMSPTRARAIALARGEAPPAPPRPRSPHQASPHGPSHQRALAQLAARPAPAPRPQAPPRFAPAAPTAPAPPVNLDPASAERLALALRDVKSGRIQGPEAQVILRLASAAIHASRY